MEVIVRSAIASDHAELKVLFDGLDRLHREHAPWLLRKPNCDPRPLEWLERIIASPGDNIFVAETENRCVGLASVLLRETPSFPVFIPQQFAVVDTLVVHRDWRRKGIARQLYLACEDWAIREKATGVKVNVYDFNSEAHDFYANSGFATTMHEMCKPLPSDK